MRDGLLALLCAVGAAACSYDWTVPTDASADGAPLDEAGADVRDATSDGAAAVDGPIDAGPDGTVVVEAGPPPCAPAEETTLQQDRAAAIDCTGITPSPCQAEVTDECGCTVVVGAANAAATAYTAEVAKVDASGCVPSCPGACGAAPMKGLCVVTDAGGGKLACLQ